MLKVRTALVLLWTAFIVRGTFYAAVLPLWEGLDEWAHFAYVDHLLKTGTLPKPETHVSEEISRSARLAPVAWSVQKMGAPAVTHDVYWTMSPEDRAAREAALRRNDPDLQQAAGVDNLYEGKQPPLYYWICVPVLKVVAESSLATRVFVLRLFTLFIGSWIIPLGFLVARRVFADERVALLTTTLLAAMPVLSMSVSRIANDALAIILFAALAWALLRPVPWDRTGSLLMGMTIGLGFLTKAYFVASVPVVVCSAAAAIWTAPSSKRPRVFGLVALSAILSVAITTWWYFRILGASGPVWADATPVANVGLQMPWWQAVENALNMHVWFAGWSFLSVRSWIYLVFRWIFLLALGAGTLALVRKTPRLPAIWGLYAGFWGAMMYHAMVTFTRAGIPSSTGHYLYAVVACETVLICSGMRLVFGNAWRYAMAGLIGLLLLLEFYAAHFVLVPYYIGLIRHRPDSSLLVFHVSQAIDLGWNEVVLRLGTNKPEFMGPLFWVLVWIGFLAASGGLVVSALDSTRVRERQHAAPRGISGS